ncbi:uncharacterized protein LOC130437768 [Triplophysa dalaica]|uniref:uncharacterized protein LOC130428867 n=1 Tax=Triplophysa dalaica TaxID=1582913 RepID=UPI0024E03EBF|nr:uncharacterized protein LOC130428867 [Triplophysa dalaica]XP_056625311.1 uncharacterized protein LOC130437768 [Triplophysa dalaica]
MMDDVDSGLSDLIYSVLPNSSSNDLLLEALQTLGVETVEDLKYVQEADLVNTIRPIEARKLIARFKAFSEKNAKEIPDLPTRAEPERCISKHTGTMPCGDHRSTSENSADHSNSPQASSSSSEVSTPHRNTPVDNNWHFNFEIPWSKMPSELTRKLENKERPTGRERRELIRLMLGEILTICPTPGKKHLCEIARKIVSRYPLSFRDVIEDQVVGSGYDSLTKQLQARLDNMKRGKTSLYLKRQTSSTSEGEDPPSKIRRVDTYGCTNWQPKRLPPGETEETQKCAQEELKNMHKNKSKNTKSIQEKMLATFYTQRSDICKMETPFLVIEWPYLFEMCGIMVHFKELTDMDVDRGAISSKSERVISYLMSHDKKNSKIGGILEGIESAKAKHLDPYLPGCVMLLLKHFSEDQAKMFVMVDETCLPSEVDQLPSTPCVVVCGSSPLTAENLMIAVDQTIVKDGVTNCVDALVMMFVYYYCLNISYPLELGATLEFMQRCLFRINPDRGTKVEKQQSKKQQSINPKVLSLITNIADFEWRE